MSPENRRRKGIRGEFRDFCPGGLTLRKKYVRFFLVKAVMKTCFSGKIPREGAILVQGIRNPAGKDTTSELPGGNTGTGAPVKASMSGSACRATRVEPWNTFVSHP